jgi:hypothetical protein
MTAAAQDQAALRDHPPGQLLDESALAHTGFALDQRHPARGASRGIPGAPERIQLRVPADDCALQRRQTLEALFGDGTRGLGVGSIRFDAAHQLKKGPAGLSAGFRSQSRAVAGIPRQRRGAVTGQKQSLDEETDRVLGDGVCLVPRGRMSYRLTPVPAGHGIPRQRRVCGHPFAEQPLPGVRCPLVERGGVPDDEAVEKTGHLVAAGHGRVLVRGAQEVHRVALEGASQLDRRAGDLEGIPSHSAQLHQCLAQGSSCRLIGMLAP